VSAPSAAVEKPVRQSRERIGMSGPRKLYVKSYGCQMNVYDSHRMADVLAPHGFIETAEPEDADLVQRAAVALSLADEIERRLAPGLPGIVSCVVRQREIVVRAPVAPGWWLQKSEERFRTVFGKRLRVETAEVKQ